MEATATESETLTLETDRPGYRVLIEGADVEVNARGTVVRKLPGTVLQFHGATATVTEGRRTPSSEPRAFVNGEEQGWSFEDFVRAIREHKFFNVRFWIPGEAPWEPRPNMAELHEMVAEAHPEDLRGMYEEERQGHNRAAALTLISDRMMAAGANGDDSGASGSD